MQGGETHAYAISVELRAVLRAVLQPPARIGWTISVPAISNPSDPAVWPLLGRCSGFPARFGEFHADERADL